MVIAAHEELEMKRISDMSSKHVRLEQPEQSQDDTNSVKKLLLWKYCDEFMDENSEKGSSLLSTQSVIDNYRKEPALSKISDPLAYWKSNQDKLPHLTRLARKYLCAPPPSVASERLFSIAANLCTDLHNNLTLTNVEYLLFLNKNLATYCGL